MAKEKVVKKEPKVAKKVETQNLLTTIIRQIRSLKLNRTSAILLIILALIIFAYLNKGLFLAATVNSQPITTAELNQRLNKLYKDKVLSQIIIERIIEQEAAKKGIVITDDQMNTRITETENLYGGKESFEALLAQQGVDRNEFLRQIRYQLMVENMYKDQAKPTEEEVQKAVEASANSPEATDPAKFKESVREALTEQKLSDLVGEKLQELRGQADVQTF